MKKLSVLGWVALSLVACTKAPAIQESDLRSADDNAVMLASFQADLAESLDFEMSSARAVENEGYSEAGGPLNYKSTCAQVTVQWPDTGLFPLQISLDYGNGCLDDGVFRAGVVSLTLSDFMLKPGSVLTINRSDNYYINGYKIEGVLTYVNESTDVQKPSWTRTVTSGAITNLKGQRFTHAGQRSVTQTAGFSTLALEDNVFEITSGAHHFEGPSGATLDLTVVSPITKANNCSYPSKGVLHIEGIVLIGDLDYGNGNCDNAAVYTQDNGLVLSIAL